MVGAHFENKSQFPTQTTKELEIMKLRGDCCYYQIWSYSCYSTLFQLHRLHSIKIDKEIDHRRWMHNDCEGNERSILILKKTTRNLQAGGNLNNNLKRSKVLAAVPTEFWCENVLEGRHSEWVGGNQSHTHTCVHHHQTCLYRACTDAEAVQRWSAMLWKLGSFVLLDAS